MDVLYHSQKFLTDRAGALSGANPGPFDFVTVATGDTLELVDSGGKRFVHIDRNSAIATYCEKTVRGIYPWREIRVTGTVKVDAIPTQSLGYIGLVTLEMTNGVSICSLMAANSVGSFVYQGFLGNPPITSGNVAGILGLDVPFDLRYKRDSNQRTFEVRMAGLLVFNMTDQTNVMWEPSGGAITVSFGRFPTQTPAGLDFSFSDVVVQAIPSVPRDLVLEGVA